MVKNGYRLNYILAKKSLNSLFKFPYSIAHLDRLSGIDEAIDEENARSHRFAALPSN